MSVCLTYSRHQFRGGRLKHGLHGGDGREEVGALKANLSAP